MNAQEKISALEKALVGRDRKKKEELQHWDDFVGEFGLSLIEEEKPRHLSRLATIDQTFVEDVVRRIIS